MCLTLQRYMISETEIYDNLNPFVLENEQIMHDRAVYLTELNKSRQERDNITVALVKTV